MKCRLLTFRLRTLIFVILLCCFGLGVLKHKNLRHRQQMAAVSAIDEAGGRAEIEQSPVREYLKLFGREYEGTFDRVVGVNLTTMRLAHPLLVQSSGPNEVANRVRQARAIDDNHLDSLAPLRDLRSLDAQGASITDAGLAKVVQLIGRGFRRTNFRDLMGLVRERPAVSRVFEYC